MVAKSIEQELIKTNEIMRAFGETLKEILPGIGFALLTFKFNDPGSNGNYISNVNRDDMIKALTEITGHLKKGENTNG